MPKFDNRFFTNASETTCDLASMLIHLDDAGLIPADMRKAIRIHAGNRMETLPRSIAASSRALASSSQGAFAIGAEDAANAAYGLASMAEQVEGFVMMVDQFNDAELAAKIVEVRHV